MTIRKFNKLYEYYKFYHDLDMKKITYQQLEEEQQKDDEWLP